jgi:hypothetical protein
MTTDMIIAYKQTFSNRVFIVGDGCNIVSWVHPSEVPEKLAFVSSGWVQQTAFLSSIVFCGGRENGLNYVQKISLTFCTIDA